MVALVACFWQVFGTSASDHLWFDARSRSSSPLAPPRPKGAEVEAWTSSPGSASNGTQLATENVTPAHPVPSTSKNGKIWQVTRRSMAPTTAKRYAKLHLEIRSNDSDGCGFEVNCLQLSCNMCWIWVQCVSDCQCWTFLNVQVAAFAES